MSFFSRFAAISALSFLAVVLNPGRSFGLWQWTTKLDTAVAQARGSDKPVLVYFYADGSVPCAGMDRETWTDATVQSMADGFVMTRLNIRNCPREVQAFSVRSVPTTVFLDANGKFTGQVVGKLSAAEASGIMSTALDRFRRMSPAPLPEPVAKPVAVPKPLPMSATAKPLVIAAAPKPVKPAAAQNKAAARPLPPVVPAAIPARRTTVAEVTVLGEPESPVRATANSGDADVYILDENGAVPLDSRAEAPTGDQKPTSSTRKTRSRRHRG